MRIPGKLSWGLDDFVALFLIAMVVLSFVLLPIIANG